MKTIYKGILAAVVCCGVAVPAVVAGDAAKTPQYKKASYVNESVTLKNDYVTLDFFKRIKGWGWAEISTPDGKLMAVLDHLGELKIRDQDIPMRLEAESYTKKQTPEGEALVFDVKSVVVRQMLNNTSFDNWMHYPLNEPAITGTVTLTLTPGSSLVKLQYRLTATGNYNAEYIRGPWLKVGEASFGTEKEDAILPGVDWVIGDEWSSGIDFFKDPWALRVAPHPNKVSVPVMAISNGGDAIGLSWDPNQVVSRWFNYRAHHPQPVFAAPNFIDRMNNQLMGLMIPDATIEGHENELYAQQIPFELKVGQQINFDAEMWLSKGNSVAVVTDWVKRHGLPEPSQTRWSYQETLDRIANAYNTNFWHEGKGFGINQKGLSTSPTPPAFLQRYIAENPKSQVVKELSAKIKSLQGGKTSSAPASKDEETARLNKVGEELLAIQRPDGSFAFDPDGRHYRKDDFKVATSFVEPMGQSGATALDITMLPTMELLEIGQKTGNQKFLDAAKKGFEFCMPMTRPEAGDFWECPLHAANLFAAGHAAVGNYLAYQAFGDQKYKDKAIYWIRTLLPFTHLWEPENIEMLYNTKPVLSSSDWYFANWVRDHVQWEVLAVFNQSSANGIYWDEIDPEIDWMTYYKGITHAAMRWLNLHTDKNWRPHNIPETYEDYQKGMFDYCFPDTHNSVTGNYGGMFIMPTAVADNIYYIMDREAQLKKAAQPKKK